MRSIAVKELFSAVPNRVFLTRPSQRMLSRDFHSSSREAEYSGSGSTVNRFLRKLGQKDRHQNKLKGLALAGSLASGLKWSTDVFKTLWRTSLYTRRSPAYIGDDL